MSGKLKNQAAGRALGRAAFHPPVKCRKGDSRSLESDSPAAGMNDRWPVLGVCVFLAATIWVAFGQTLHHEFVTSTTTCMLYDNPVVQKGLTWEGFRWALTYGQIGHWHPLNPGFPTCWTAVVRVECRRASSDKRPAHTASAILLFLVLRRMTGFSCGAARLWRWCLRFIRCGRSRWRGGRATRTF